MIWDAFPSGHLVPSHVILAFVLILKQVFTNFVIFPDFEFHGEDYKSCAPPFNSIEQIIPKALHSD